MDRSGWVFRFSSLACLLVLSFSLAGCKNGPEYEEPDVSDPHGILVVKPLLNGKGGGLRTIDGKLVFPRRGDPKEREAYKFRAWRVSPGMREVEIFGVGNFLRRTIRVREGKRTVFFPKKYMGRESGGGKFVLGVYAWKEEPLPGEGGASGN